jgi:hypothetical protein
LTHPRQQLPDLSIVGHEPLDLLEAPKRLLPLLGLHVPLSSVV